MTKIEITKYLKDLKNRTNPKEEYEKYSKFLNSLKQKYIIDNNQKQAKRIWCLEQILDIQNEYLFSYDNLRNHIFYEAWIKFEQIEIKLSNLNRHFKEKNNDFFLLEIAEYTKKFQSLYPYKFFFSTGEIVKEKICSVCGKKVNLRNHCGHEVGEIYNGEMCCRIIKHLEKLTDVSIVESPARKYAVAFSSTKDGHDSYNYAALKYLIKHLESPFEKWDYELTTKRHPHDFFPSLNPNDNCPCNSGKKYIDCCKSEDSILMPHYQFTLYSPKLKNFDLEYSY